MLYIGGERLPNRRLPSNVHAKIAKFSELPERRLVSADHRHGGGYPAWWTQNAGELAAHQGLFRSILY